MELQHALKQARELVSLISPYCRRVEIAGSIRREKPQVKDVEIVAIPQWEEHLDPSDLFGERKIHLNRLHQWATSPACPVRWIKPGTSELVPWKVEPQGRYWRGLLQQDLKLDLFLCTPDNWGAIYLIRTGSAEFSFAVATRAKKLGMPFSNGTLTREGKPLATPEERHVFGCLGLEWREPHERTGWDAVREVPRRSHSDRFLWREGDIEIL